jgi:hypothetical protein
MSPDTMNTLNHAGEALKALGEQSVVFGFFPASDLHIADTYTIRLDLPGTPGCHGSGRTPAEAYQNAIIQRKADARRLEREARIRAAVEAEEAAEQREAA